MTLKQLTPFALVAMLSATRVSAQDPCSAVLGNVYDKTTYSGYHIASRSFESFFCERSYSSESQARDAAAQVGVVIDGLPLQLGGHYRSTDWSAYAHELCRMVRSNEEVNEGVYAQIQQVDQGVVAAWTQCITSSGPGLRFWAEVDDHARTVAFLARWQPTGTTDPFILLKDRRPFIAPAGLLTCTDRFPERIGVGPESVLCTRVAGQDGAASASLKTRHNGSPKISVPAIPPPPLPVVEVPCLSPILLSRNAPVVASYQPGAELVTDGTPANWNSQGFPTQWVRIRLPQASRIHSITFNPEQHVAARTAHQVSVKQRQSDGAEELVILAVHDSVTVSGGVFSVVPVPQAQHVTEVEVTTLVSPSWVSWREIEVFGCKE